MKGNVFGTLCVMDKEEKVFSEEDINYLKSMADISSDMIELDQTKYSMGFLSVPSSRSLKEFPFFRCRELLTAIDQSKS